MRQRLELALVALGTAASVHLLARIVEPKPPVVTDVFQTPLEDVSATLGEPAAPLKAPPAFAQAVAQGNLARMKWLYTPGMALDGMLGPAAASGKLETVQWLLDHNADVHENETQPNAPVLLADDHSDVVRLLIARGAREPSLATAAGVGARHAVDRLVWRADVNEGAPLARVAASEVDVFEKYLIAERLLDVGADPNLADAETGATPLSAALSTCQPGDEKGGGGVRGVRPPGSSGGVRGVRPPGSSGGVRGVRPQGRSGAVERCLPLIRTLIAHGARTTGVALQNAVIRGPGPLLDVVLDGRLERGATATALASVVHPEVVKKVAARGVDWGWRDGEEDAQLPLISAVERLDAPIVKALLEAGAPADRHFKDGRCALGEAIGRIDSESAEAARIIELLLAHGANPNRRFADGRTPLFAAAQAGDTRIIHALLDRGARVNEAVLDDRPLDAAEGAGKTDAARVLHARGGRRVRKKP